MRDIFLVHHRADHHEAGAIADSLRGRGLTLGEPVELWTAVRLLPRIDRGLVEARYALVLVSREFLLLSYPRKELDGLTTRSKVICLLHGVAEEDVRDSSPRLAVAAIPGSMAEHLVRLVRAE